jgi:hypothetical protein
MLRNPSRTTLFSLLLLFPYTILILSDNYRFSLPNAISPHMHGDWLVGYVNAINWPSASGNR